MSTPENDGSLKTKVLYVDDEPSNLSSFNASFRKEFDVMVAENAEEGMKILESAPDTHVVIADQRMPGTTGVEFLSQIRPVYPDIIRILLTGYSDIEAVIGAINEGQVYRYIDKPWDFENIKIALKNAREIYDTRRELKEKNKSLQKALKELDQFVYSVSHDIRAPLTSIQGIINLAKMETEDPSSIEYFDMIKSMVDKLDTFVHQVIDYYYGNRQNRNKDVIDFENMIANIIEGYRLDPETQDIDINIDLNVQEDFVSNNIKIKIILGNLISNSIKYQKDNSSDKSVMLNVRADSNYAHIVIEDNGVGIEEEQLERVFDMFHRASHKSIGSGLGLYIVKESVESLGGSINLSSKEGEGTRIELTIPSMGKSQTTVETA